MIADYANGMTSRVIGVRRLGGSMVARDGRITFDITNCGDRGVLRRDETVILELSLAEWDDLLAFLANKPPVAKNKAANGGLRTSERWSEAEEDQLIALFRSGRLPETIAFELGRTRGAIVSRLERLGLVARGVLRPNFAAAQRDWVSHQQLSEGAEMALLPTINPQSDRKFG